MSRNKATEERIDVYVALKVKLMTCDQSKKGITGISDEERLLVWNLTVEKIKRLQDGTDHVCEFPANDFHCIVCGEIL